MLAIKGPTGSALPIIMAALSAMVDKTPNGLLDGETTPTDPETAAPPESHSGPTTAKPDGPPADAQRAWPSKHFKASDLPLSQDQKTATDSLVQTYKRQGTYDAIRKDVLEKFEASVGHVSHAPPSTRATILTHPHPSRRATTLRSNDA